MTTAAIRRLLTLGQVGERCHVATWKIQRLYERGLLPPAQRVGPYRVIDEGELPAVEAALRAAGYLPRTSEGPAPAEVRQ